MEYENIKLILKDKLSYKWSAAKEVYVRGYAFNGETLLIGKDLIEYFEGIISEKDFAARLSCLEGIYNIIVITPSGTFACVDQVRSMPLFYDMDFDDSGKVTLLDAIDETVATTKEIEQDVLKVFRYALFTLDDKTIFKNVYEIKAGHYLRISHCGVEQISYVFWYYAEKRIRNLENAVSQLHINYLATFQRVIRVLDHRTAVIPLSGGHDSRMIGFYLKALGYEKIIAYSYGFQNNNEEAKYSKMSADVLGIPWYFVPYNAKEMHRLFRQEGFHFLIDAGNGVSVPCLQEWYAIYKLCKDKYLPGDSVILPGYSGDFLAGSHLLQQANGQKSINSKEIVDYFMRYHFSNRKAQSVEMDANLRETICLAVPALKSSQKDFFPDEANFLSESFDLVHRQAKFIVNAVRVYDYFGYQWMIPYFERSQFDVWAQIDNCLRYNRKAFFALEQHIYPESLKKISFAGETRHTFFARVRALLRRLRPAHFMYGYYALGIQYYIQYYHQKLENVDCLAQDAYLSCLADCREESEQKSDEKKR